MVSPVWQTVAQLEKEFYTREEIADSLRTVASTIERDESEYIPIPPETLYYTDATSEEIANAIERVENVGDKEVITEVTVRIPVDDLAEVVEYETERL